MRQPLRPTLGEPLPYLTLTLTFTLTLGSLSYPPVCYPVVYGWTLGIRVAGDWCLSLPGSNCVELRIEREGCFCYCFATLETLEHNQKQKMHSLNGATLTPAYGRDYTSGKDAIASFESGKDFNLASLFHGSGYVSIRDFVCGDRVSIRYGKLRKVVGHVVKGGAE